MDNEHLPQQLLYSQLKEGLVDRDLKIQLKEKEVLGKRRRVVESNL